MTRDARQRALRAAALITEQTPVDTLRWVTGLLVHVHEATKAIAHPAGCEVCAEVNTVVPLLSNTLATT